jgi:hypothetical protein
MASSLLSKVTGGHMGSSGETATEEETSKYRLLVTAGSAYDLSTHKLVHVNTNTPTIISNAFLTAKISVRVKDYRGLPSSSPSSSPYFDDPVHKHDLYSIAFSFVPKRDLPSADTVWGNDFDHPIRDRIPPGFNTAFRIVKEFIDPGLSCDAYADEPWLYGPSLSCWFGFHIGDVVPEASAGNNNNVSSNSSSSNKNQDEEETFPAPDETHPLTEGSSGTGTSIRNALNLPPNNEKRRKHFLSPTNREAFTFERNRCYQGDFYNPYIDFGNFLLKLPGFSLKVIKYVEGKTHCLRYVFKNRTTGEVYFNVNFWLVWGEQLEWAMEEDAKGSEGDLVRVLLPRGQAQGGAADAAGAAVARPEAQRTASHPSLGLDEVE